MPWALPKGNHHLVSPYVKLYRFGSITMKKVAIVQSNYIPWKGYFDLISSVDEFVLYDDAQYTRRDWRNRNRIKTPQGVRWLTVPVKAKGNYHQPIRDIEIDGTRWAENHWNILTQSYRRADHFREIANWLEPLYLEGVPKRLSDLNRKFIHKICDYLNITTKITDTGEYNLDGDRSERLANICKQSGATHYVSGPSARNYMKTSIFEEEGLNVIWFNYDKYPCYPQLWGDYVSSVSIIDLLFNCGMNSRKYMRSVK